MTRTSKNYGKGEVMRAVGVFVCALSVVTTLVGVARSGDSEQCRPSASCPLVACDPTNSSSICTNVTNVTPLPVGKNATFVGAVCLKPSDSKGLKAARHNCEELGEDCCMEGEFEACPTSKPFNSTSLSNNTNICQFSRCPLGQRLWFCKLEPDDD